MKKIIVFLFGVACLATIPTAGFAEVLVADLDAVEGGVLMVDPVEPIAPVDPVVDPVPESIPVDDPIGSIATPTGLMVVMAAIAPIVIEWVKLIPGTAPWMLRILAVIVGMLGGLFVGLGWFGAVPYNLGVAILAGAAGGGGFTLMKWGSQAARSGKRPAGFASIRAMLLLGISGVLLFCMIGMTGCGHTFTAAPGAKGYIDIKPTKPAYGAMLIDAAEVCRMNVPDGTIDLRNICGAGEVSTMAADGVTPTCVPNPCGPGLTFAFETSGLAVCR